MINNFEAIKPLLVFPDKDNFYFVQILQRKKDHKGVMLGGSNNNSRLIRAYFVTSVERLEQYREEMVKLAEVFNARVSINLNPRSFEKAAFHLLQKVADQMSNKDFRSAAKAYNSVCGHYHSEMDKRWLIDIDSKEPQVLGSIMSTVASLQSEILNREYKIEAVLPSKSGFHIICNPFNLQKFSQANPGIEVHKNNPTNLYIP